jgi:hypothetical protein
MTSKPSQEKLEQRYATERKDCFAWHPEHYCDALKVMDCEHCSFYKLKTDVG